MMKTQIPGWGELEIKNLILDFNGTIAKDGKVLEGVKELLGKIHEAGIEIYVVTADTNGTVAAECETLPVHVKIFGSDTVARDKRCLCQELGLPEHRQHRQRQKRHPGIPGKCAFDCGHRQRGRFHQIRNAGRRSGQRCLPGTGTAAFSKPPDRHPARVGTFPQRAPEPGALFVFQEPGKGRGHRMVV